MHYNLVTNSVDTDRVEEQTIDGSRYLVAKDVPFIQPQRLAGGYVPRKHVEASAPDWDGQPLGVNHPRDDDGRVVSYNSDLGQQIVVGHARNPSRNSDGSISADLAVNADRAAEIGGEAQDIVTALEAGDPLEVSSQYFADPLPAGVYDGQHREEVEGNLDPDGIALLPNKQGVCSLPDCGFDPQGATANSAAGTTLRVPTRSDDPAGEALDSDETMHANATDYRLTTLTPEDVDAWTDGEWDGSAATAALPDPSEDTDAGDLLDATHAVQPTAESDRDAASNWKLPFRTSPDAPVNTRALVAIDAALSGGRSGVEGLGQNVTDDVSEWVASMLEAAPDDLFGSTEEGEPSSNTLFELGQRVASTLGLTDGSPSDEPAESGMGFAESPGEAPRGSSSDPASEPGSDMKRDTLIDEITANSSIKRESLEGMGDTCLQNTHEHVVANSDDEDEDEEEEEAGGQTTTDGQTLGDMTVDELGDALADQGFVTEGDLGEAVANAQEMSAKEQRVERIIANSSEYDSDDKGALMDTADSVLENIEGGLSSNSTLPGATGAAERATANANDGGDVDEYPDGTIGGGA